MSRSLSAEVKRQRRCSLEAWGNARATPQEPCADTASAESATHHDRASIPPKASLVSRLDLRLHLQKRLASTNECQRRIVVNNSPDFARLFRNTLGALLLCAVLVLLCYLFVDPPFPFFVHDHRFADYAVWKWLIYPPPVLQAWAPVVLAGLMVRRVYGHFRRWELAVPGRCHGSPGLLSFRGRRDRRWVCRRHRGSVCGSLQRACRGTVAGTSSGGSSERAAAPDRVGKRRSCPLTQGSHAGDTAASEGKRTGDGYVGSKLVCA
jgi:hypothetical protein